MEINDIISSGLLELYAAGATSESEAQQVEQWANQYPEIKKEIDELQLAMENYAAANAMQPDEDVKEKILSRIKINSQTNGSAKTVAFNISSTPVYRIPSYFKWLAAASVILLLGSLIFNYIFYTKYQSSADEIFAANKRYDSARQSDSEALVAANLATDKYSVPVVLKGTNHTPDALAKIFWMKNSGEVYVDATYLPAPPAGKQYQLWAIVDGKPVDAGMITTSKGTYKIQKMKSFGSAQAFAITMEKTGGSPTPTMDQMVVKANI